jgi:NDP-sugar pyrophosphorylase family protein
MKNEARDLQIVVISGGLATRLGKITKNQPKSMVKICGVPFLQYQLELFKQNGIFRVVLCLGHFGEQIESFFGNGSRFEMDIRYSFENKPLGTAGALKNAISLLDNEFFTIYGDSYPFLDFSNVLDYFHSKNKLALMTVYKNNNLYGSSNTIISGEMVTKYNKKEKTPEMTYIEYGVNLFRKDILKRIPDDSFYEMGGVFNSLIEENQLLSYEIKERFYEIGSPWGLAAFKEYIGAI